MISCLLDLQRVVERFAEENGEDGWEVDWGLLKKIARILEPFKQFTLDVS